MTRLRKLGIVAIALLALLAATGAFAAWRQQRRPAGLSAAARCRLGAYRLPGGRLFAVRQREDEDLRFVFQDGFAPAASPQEKGGTYRSQATAADGKTPALVATFAACERGTIQLSIDGGAPQEAHRVSLVEQSARFSSRDIELMGKLVLPPGDAAVPLVVLVHGSERDSAILGEEWQYLLPAQGVGVFVYDKRGTGESGGRYTQDFDLLAADAIAAAGTARRLAGARGGELGFFGGSQGGWIAPLAATRSRAEFVIAAYGLAESPLGEDREQVFTDLRDAGFGDAATLAKARELTAATGRVMATDFHDGWDDLAAVKRKYAGEPWLPRVRGEFTGSFLRYPRPLLRALGPLLDVGTSWEYDPRPTLERLAVPQLWVLAGDDHEAPSATTLAILRDLQRRRPELDVAVFPHADHGILEPLQAPDGSVRGYRYSVGYHDLIVDWIRTRKLAAVAPDVELHEGGGGSG